MNEKFKSKRVLVSAIFLIGLMLGSVFYAGYSYAASSLVVSPSNIVLYDRDGVGDLNTTGNMMAEGFYWRNGSAIGQQGLSGTNGTNGANGSNGADGDDGSNGVNGADGNSTINSFTYLIGDYGNGTYYCMKGNTSAIVDTDVNSATLTSDILTGVITSGTLVLNQVPFSIALMNSIPQNVRVVCSYQDEIVKFINPLDTSGPPYTIEEGAGVTLGYYTVKDSANRICLISTEYDDVFLNAISGGDVTVTHAKGLYIVTDEIVITGDYNNTLIVIPEGVEIRKADNTQGMIYYTNGASHITFMGGGTVNGNYANQASGYDMEYCFWIRNSEYVTIKELYVVNGTWQNIQGSNSRYLTIENNVIDYCLQNDCVTFDNCSDSIITENFVSRSIQNFTGDGRVGSGIEARNGSSRIWITYNTVTNCHNGIMSNNYDGDSFAPNDVYIDHNTISEVNAAHQCIDVTGKTGEYLTGIHITNNKVTGGQWGIRLTYSNDSEIFGNTMKGALTAGMKLEYVFYSDVSKNDLSNSVDTSAIDLSHVSYTTLDKNTAKDFTGHGIVLNPYCTDNIITNNHLLAITFAGIRVPQSSGTTVRNIISQNILYSSTGILFTNATDQSANFIFDNSLNGVWNATMP
jgi:parallel beta-helix repeat protein